MFVKVEDAFCVIIGLGVFLDVVGKGVCGWATVGLGFCSEGSNNDSGFTRLIVGCELVWFVLFVDVSKAANPFGRCFAACKIVSLSKESVWRHLDWVWIVIWAESSFARSKDCFGGV